jgi:hypothetical protein
MKRHHRHLIDETCDVWLAHAGYLPLQEQMSGVKTEKLRIPLPGNL